ncbi:MAG: hypothetical protein F6K47_30135 [Symploca sp. SIO2E6]|nr:hypothetical protein [Symploca sp. SIO2E6]
MFRSNLTTSASLVGAGLETIYPILPATFVQNPPCDMRSLAAPTYDDMTIYIMRSQGIGESVGNPQGYH